MAVAEETWRKKGEEEEREGDNVDVMPRGESGKEGQGEEEEERRGGGGISEL